MPDTYTTLTKRPIAYTVAMSDVLLTYSLAHFKSIEEQGEG